MIDVLGLGSIALDDILLIDEWPAPDAKLRVLSRGQRLGGLTGHALVAAARAGARCAYGGRLGTDADSVAAAHALEAAGVSTAPALRDPACGIVRSTIIAARRSGTRNVFSHASGQTGAHPEEPAEEIIRSARVVLVDHHGVDGGIRAASLARATVADLERDDHPRFHELLACVDHLILSRGFACRITQTSTPAAAVQALWNGARQAVIVTSGAEGCWWRDAEATEAQHYPALPVTVQDSSGCGDIFHGVYAARLAAGDDLAERLRRATDAAGQHAAAGSR